MRENGNTPRNLSWPDLYHLPTAPGIRRTSDTTLRCDSITPLGNPVVPELYASTARSWSGSNFRRRYRVDPDVLRMLVQCLMRWESSRAAPSKITRSSGILLFFAASRAAGRKALVVAIALASEFSS